MGLYHEDTKEVSDVNPLLEIRSLPPNNGVEMCFGFGERVCPFQIVRHIGWEDIAWGIGLSLAQKDILFGSRKFREASQHAHRVAVERLDQGPGYAEDMKAPVFVVITIAGVVEGNKWIPGDVEQSSSQSVMLGENSLRKSGIHSVEGSRLPRHQIVQHFPFSRA